MCTDTAKLILFQSPGNEDDLIGRMCIIHGIKTIRARSFLPTIIHNLELGSFTCSYNEKECAAHGWIDCVCSGYPEYKVNINLVVPEERAAYRARYGT